MAAKDEESHHKNPRLEEMRSLTELCDLPGEVLICILSLLATKSAVCTSILSRKWRYLWVSITNLKFSEGLIFHNQRNRFIDFVDKAMALRGNSSLVSFSLSCSILGDASRINTWITIAIQCNVKELSLNLQVVEYYLLPRSIFECQSLVKLELSMSDGYILKLPSSVCSLPRLKYLKLWLITFTDDGSLEKLVSACPLLEKLYVWSCNWDNIGFVSIYAPKLEILDIDDRGDQGDGKVCIIGENLKSFTYMGTILSNEYHIRASSTHLFSVEINLREGVDYENVAPKRCYKILSGLSGVQKLTLTDFFLEYLEREPELLDTIPVFQRLAVLNLEGSSDIRMDREVTMKIFERCPHLFDLTISEPFSVFSELMTPIPSCFRNAAVLEDMDIFLRHDAFGDHHSGSYDFGYKIEEYYQEELNQRVKVSKDCRVLVLFDTIDD